MRKKGFTLIELLGVLVLMGLIMLIVFPSLSKVTKDNQGRKFLEYYTVMKEAVKLYATTYESDSIGNTNQRGCVRFKYSDLLNAGFIEKYQDKAYKLKEEDIDIVVKNDRGKITSFFELKFDKINYLKEEKIGEKADVSMVCEKAPNEIKNTLINLYNDTNKYIYYGSHLWEIVKVNQNGSIKAKSIDILTVIPFKVKDKFAPREWLINEFFKYLPNSDRILVQEKYKYEKTEYVDKIGLPDEDDTCLSLKNNGSGIGTCLRASINFNPDLKVIKGIGSKESPFIIYKNIRKNPKKAAEYLKVGDYVEIKDRVYRVMGYSNNKIKIISTKPETAPYLVTIKDSDKDTGRNYNVNPVSKMRYQCGKEYHSEEDYETTNTLDPNACGSTKYLPNVEFPISFHYQKTPIYRYLKFNLGRYYKGYSYYEYKEKKDSKIKKFVQLTNICTEPFGEVEYKSASGEIKIIKYISYYPRGKCYMRKNEQLAGIHVNDSREVVIPKFGDLYSAPYYNMSEGFIWTLTGNKISEFDTRKMTMIGIDKDGKALGKDINADDLKEKYGYILPIVTLFEDVGVVVSDDYHQGMKDKPFKLIPIEENLVKDKKWQKEYEWREN